MRWSTENEFKKGQISARDTNASNVLQSARWTTAISQIRFSHQLPKLTLNTNMETANHYPQQTYGAQTDVSKVQKKGLGLDEILTALEKDFL